MNEPQVAPGLLGSALLLAAKAHARRLPPPASSGYLRIDEEALDKGFKYGEITSIAGASGTAKKTVRKSNT